MHAVKKSRLEHQSTQTYNMKSTYNIRNINQTIINTCAKQRSDLAWLCCELRELGKTPYIICFLCFGCLSFFQCHEGVYLMALSADLYSCTWVDFDILDSPQHWSHVDRIILALSLPLHLCLYSWFLNSFDAFRPIPVGRFLFFSCFCFCSRPPLLFARSKRSG